METENLGEKFVGNLPLTEVYNIVTENDCQLQKNFVSYLVMYLHILNSIIIDLAAVSTKSSNDGVIAFQDRKQAQVVQEDEIHVVQFRAWVLARLGCCNVQEGEGMNVYLRKSDPTK